MVKRHTTVPFQFHCLTDDPVGLDPEINAIQLPKDPWIKSWWSKLWMFSPDMPLKGNILFFDLDVIIFNNIDELEQLVTQQKMALDQEEKERELYKKFGL